MQASSCESNVTSRRQLCNRCYGQKLRCKRADNDDAGTCEKCLRTGSECTYGLCLPKGRSSLNRARTGASAQKPPPAKSSKGSSDSAADPASTSLAFPVLNDPHYSDISSFSCTDPTGALWISNKRPMHNKVDWLLIYIMGARDMRWPSLMLWVQHLFVESSLPK